MTKTPDDHGSFLDLLRVLGFDDINHVEASEGGITILPFDPRAFAFNLFRNFFG